MSQNTPNGVYLIINTNFTGINMKQKWKKTQYVEISIDEIFCFMDKLDAVKDTPEKVWDVVDDFFMECEAQLELNPTFLKSLQELDLEKDFVPLKIEDLDDLFDDEDFDTNYNIAQDYVNYCLALKKKKYDIPFTPRHSF